MNFKSFFSFAAAILLSFASCEVLADSKMYYFYVGYLAQPASYQYQHIYEK